MADFYEQEHLNSLFENATEGIILTDRSGKIVLVNPSAERMFGYQADEITGEPIEILIPDKTRTKHRELREGFYIHPSNRSMGHNRDLHGRKKDGSNIPVEVSLSHYKKNDEIFVIAFIVDITARKEIENSMRRQQAELERVSQEIRKLNAELENKVEERTMILREALQKLEQSQVELNEALRKEKQLSEIKSRFVSMASHEFRTPLSAVLSSAALLSKYTAEGDQDKRNRHITKIKNSVHHLNDILEDFLSLGKLDEGKVSSTLTPFNLKQLLEEVMEEMKLLLKPGQKLELEFNADENILSDTKLLKNIIINLVTNAIKFSNEDGLIRIGCEKKPGITKISVEDNGIGIGAEDQEHLFSSFFRGANALNIQGTGLGLHIVKRYADLIGADVDLKSELNRGTTVSLFIPSK
ncbi:PAS domain-containing sensor histidine kinase [Pollutibacter soli]|uniref:PAS domain-containing sensor histidine kinase n=1 Tax=Pollutibacter soli TaxID=3034157 RepID=UPI0030139073